MIQWAKQKGFTIVELLIVVVVIAILAAITIVAYTGIQNSANDSSIQSDLSNIAKQYEMYKTSSVTDQYPYGEGLNTGVTITMSVNKNAYATTSYQLLNCTNSSSPGSNYAVLALSKSGKRFYVASNSGGVREYTGTGDWLTTSACPSVLAGSAGNGAGYSSGTGWRAWITN